MTGLEMVTEIREKLLRQIPVIFLTGDISTATLRDIALRGCIQLNKPVKLTQLTEAVQRHLPTGQPELRARIADPATATGNQRPPVVFVVDDDEQVREAIRSVLEDDGRAVEDFPSCEAFLEGYRPGREACLLVDAHLPGMKGVELLQRLKEAGHSLPAVMITGNSDVPMAVEAMKAGAFDLIEKPVSRGDLLACVERAFDLARDSSKLVAWQSDAASHVATLTDRQRQIMEMVLAGHPSKNIAADLGISQRTVENHRAAIMKKTGSKSLPALARVSLAAAWNDAGEPFLQPLAKLALAAAWSGVDPAEPSRTTHSRSANRLVG
jgi:two-component system CheB/CheR fusion protein